MSPIRILPTKLSTIHADACVVGAGAGGAVGRGRARRRRNARGRPRAGARARSRHLQRPPTADACAAVPRRRADADLRQPADRAAAGPWPRRHDADQLGNLLSDAAARARALADRVRARPRRVLDAPVLRARRARRCRSPRCTPELAGENAAVARRGAERLGWSHGYLRRNAKGCVGSGVCAFGCPTSAKQHTGITYIPRGRRRPAATVLTGADVRRVLVRRRRADGVSVRTAAGAHVTSARRSSWSRRERFTRRGCLPAAVWATGSGQLGRNLSLHPATAAVARMEHVVDMARGVPQSFYIDEFAGEGIMLEGVAGPPVVCRDVAAADGTPSRRSDGAAIASWRSSG